METYLLLHNNFIDMVGKVSLFGFAIWTLDTL